MTSATQAVEISHLITDGSVTRLADRLVTLTEDERAELGGHLPGFVKDLRARRDLDPWGFGRLVDDQAGTLLLAGIGVITGPAAAVTWMTSRDVNRRWAELDVAAACRVAVRLHTLLDPTPAESAPRVRDYLRLLPSAPGPVAELAAAQIRRALPLDHADLVEAVEALTFRAEAKLAALGLRWTDQTIRATPERAEDFVTALTMAYAHTSFDVRKRAAELTLKHAGRFAGHAEAFLAAIPELPAELGSALATRFGGPVPVEDAPERKEFPPLPEPPEAEPFPESSIVPSGLDEGVRLEHWLAAFVAGIHADRAELRHRLTPYVERQSRYRQDRDRRTTPGAWQTALAAELVSPGSLPVVPPLGPERFWEGESYSTQVVAVTRRVREEPPHDPLRPRVQTPPRPAQPGAGSPDRGRSLAFDGQRGQGRGGDQRGNSPDDEGRACGTSSLPVTVIT